MKRAELTLIIAALALAAFLRFDHLGGPSYWLDEILGDQLTTHYAATARWWHWITGFEREHGPLYYATQLAARAAGHDEAAGRLPAALFGLAAIPLVFLCVDRSASMAGVASAIILAVSPLHVYYSREARPYALLMLLTAALLLALLRQRIGATIAILVAMLYTSAVAAPLFVAAALTMAGAALLTRNRRQWLFAALPAAAVVLVPLLYRGPAAPPLANLDEKIATKIVRALTVSAHGGEGHAANVAILFLFAIIGAVALARRDRRAAAIVVGMTVLPAVCAVASLAAINHWFAVRYIAPALIGFVVLAGIGISTIRWPHALVAVLIAAAIAADTWGAARREPFQKLDWRAIGAALAQHVTPGDAIVTAEAWSDVCLRYYLRGMPPAVRVVGVNNVTVAEMLTYASPVWFVSAQPDGAPVRDWICRYPLLLAAPIEEFRLHYAPSARHFVRERSRPEDVRALAAALGPHVALRIGRDDEALRGDGWQGPEGPPGGEFRWALAKEASLVIPRAVPAHRRIGVHALPFFHRALPPQTMRVALNGHVIADLTMPVEWHDYLFDAPAPLWREGLNTLTFTFGRVNSLSQFDGPAADARPMAAAFDQISIDDIDARPGQALMPVLTPRFASETLLRTRSGWPAEKTRFEHVNRGELQALLGRLGFDPQSRDAHVEDVAAAIAYESGCESDRAFLDRAFAELVQRNPNPGEQADLLPRMRSGATRVEIIGRILRAEDLRKRLTP